MAGALCLTVMVHHSLINARPQSLHWSFLLHVHGATSTMGAAYYTGYGKEEALLSPSDMMMYEWCTLSCSDLL